MTKEQILAKAKYNKDKAFLKFMKSSEKTGITEEERDNLWSNVEYANIVYDILCKELKAEVT